MKEMQTKYGLLKGIISYENYSNGNLKECILSEKNEVMTDYGLLVPQYEEDHVRRKYTFSLSFYENGYLKSISLNQQTDIVTALGTFQAEKLTFYEDGRLKRLFPVNGKLTGYWTEDNEYHLAQKYVIKLGVGEIKCKVISLQFYKSQKLKSITLWPKEHVTIRYDESNVEVRTGLAFYENGSLKSFEPAKPTPINTPIGTIMAYDNNIMGIHGDTNSVQLYEDGSLKSIVSATDKIEIFDEYHDKTTYAPEEKQSLMHLHIMDTIPLRIAFYNGKVSMNEELEYEIKKHTFIITHHYKPLTYACSDCSSCNLCG